MPQLDHGRLAMDGERRMAIVSGREVPLSATEYKILEGYYLDVSP